MILDLNEKYGPVAVRVVAAALSVAGSPKPPKIHRWAKPYLCCGMVRPRLSLELGFGLSEAIPDISLSLGWGTFTPRTYGLPRCRPLLTP